MALEKALEPEATEILADQKGCSKFVTLHANDRLRVTTSFDRSVRIWDPASGRPLTILRGLTSGVPHAVFIPDGRVAAGDWDGNLRIWDISPLLPKTSDPAPPAAIQSK